jgi:uncharacterized protein YkwD
MFSPEHIFIIAQVYSKNRSRERMIPISTNRIAVYSAPVILILIITLFCAGCTEPSDDTITTQPPAISSVQSRFAEGDIIAKTVSSTDQFMLILHYDADTGNYERAIVNKRSDGSWFRNTNQSERIDRTLMEKVYPAKVGHVGSLSQVPVETRSFTSLPEQTEFVPSTSATTRTPVPTITSSQSKTTIAATPATTPEIVRTTESPAGNSPPVIDIPALEMEIHILINDQRRINGLVDLGYDSSLASVARKHSADMAQNNYFSHYDLQGLDPTARGSLDGYSCDKNYGAYSTSGISENILQNNRYDSVIYYNGISQYTWNSPADIAQSTVRHWMSSPGHRQNILTSTYDREGIGVAIASDDKVYITEDFC